MGTIGNQPPRRRFEFSDGYVAALKERIGMLRGIGLTTDQGWGGGEFEILGLSAIRALGLRVCPNPAIDGLVLPKKDRQAA